VRVLVKVLMRRSSVRGGPRWRGRCGAWAPGRR
jgi:hypothetical protein